MNSFCCLWVFFRTMRAVRESSTWSPGDYMSSNCFTRRYQQPPAWGSSTGPYGKYSTILFTISTMGTRLLMAITIFRVGPAYSESEQVVSVPGQCMNGFVLIGSSVRLPTVTDGWLSFSVHKPFNWLHRTHIRDVAPFFRVHLKK